MQARVVPVSAIEGVAWPDAGGVPLLSDPGLLGGDESGAAALNAAGQVVGIATNANGEYRPCLWNGRGASDLGVLPGGRNGVGAGIDPHGRVVGWCHDDRHGDRAVLWWNGALIELGGLAERGESQALAINAAGLLVGNAQTARGERHACLWRAGQVTDLGALGGDGSAAYALNDAGLIVGMARDANGRDHATTWREGHAALALGSPVPGASRARGLNSAGVIVGSVTGGGEPQPCRWDGAGGALLALAPDWVGGEATAINATEQIVGAAQDSLGGRRACLWEGGEPRDLNALIDADSGWLLEHARGIGNSGLIVGQGRFQGQARAFLLDLRRGVEPASGREANLGRRRDDGTQRAHGVRPLR